MGWEILNQNCLAHYSWCFDIEVEAIKMLIILSILSDRITWNQLALLFWWNKCWFTNRIVSVITFSWEINSPFSSVEIVFCFPDMKVTFVSSPPTWVNLTSVMLLGALTSSGSTKLLICSVHLSEIFNIISSGCLAWLCLCEEDSRDRMCEEIQCKHILWYSIIFTYINCLKYHYGMVIHFFKFLVPSGGREQMQTLLTIHTNNYKLTITSSVFTVQC